MWQCLNEIGKAISAEQKAKQRWRFYENVLKHAICIWNCHIPILFPDICCDLCKWVHEFLGLAMSQHAK